MSRISSFLPILFLLIFSILSRGNGKGKKTDAKAGSPTPARPAGTAAARTRTPARRASKDGDCEYGEVNHRYSHSVERRTAQLNGYLQAGLIDKKEYNQMLERYKRMDQEAGLD